MATIPIATKIPEALLIISQAAAVRHSLDDLLPKSFFNEMFTKKLKTGELRFLITYNCVYYLFGTKPLRKMS